MKRDRPAWPETQDGPPERIQPEHLLHRQRQTINALAEIDRPRRHETFTGPPWPSIMMPLPAPPGSSATAVPHRHWPRRGSRHLR
jgi:hypothetical protein